MAHPHPGRAPGLRILSIGGVPVHIGWSWFLLAAVITVVFGAQLAERTRFGYAIGVSYAVLLLVAVLAHEGAHALAARSFRIPVHRIVADFLGGHTAFDGRSLTPMRAAVIAAAGPLANGALGLLGVALQAVVTDPVVGLVLAGVAWINLLLAAFNLLPGLPLDGGQVVEAIVWGLTGRRSAGMIVAGWGGRVLTLVIAWWALVRPLAAGVQPSLYTVLWAFLLGSVIWRGGTQAITVGRVRAALDGIRIAQVAAPATVLPASATVADLTLMPPAGAVFVTDPALGLLRVTHPPDGVPDATPVSALATPVPAEAVVEVAVDADVWGAFPALQAQGGGVVVLTDRGRVWGVLTAALLEAHLGVARASR